MPNPKRGTSLKIVAGTYRKDRDAPRKAAPVSTPGEPPSYFTTSQVVLWREVVASAPPGHLTKMDRSAIEGYSVLWDARNRAGELLNASGGQLIVRSSDGHKRPIQNPYLRAFRSLTADLAALESVLGCSPRARSSMNINVDAFPDDPLARYL